jgi:hypothetical protein
MRSTIDVRHASFSPLAAAALTVFDCRSTTQNYLHGRAGRLLSRPSPELSWQNSAMVVANSPRAFMSAFGGKADMAYCSANVRL